MSPVNEPVAELEGAVVVLLGQFNPSIFQPAWLARQGLVSDTEANAAQVEIILPDLALFRIGELRIEVRQDRFVVEATPESAQLARDLVVGAFRILEHAPLRQLGINRHMHFRMPSEDRWHAVGHGVAPKEPWEGILDNPGLWHLQVKGSRPDASSKHLLIGVAPSTRVRPGVYVMVNEHFESTGPASAIGLIQLLKDNWEDSQRYATVVAKTLLMRYSGDR